MRYAVLILVLVLSSCSLHPRTFDDGSFDKGDKYDLPNPDPDRPLY